MLLTLIRRAATLEQASGVLASKGLAHSASSWDELLEKRLRPALATGALTADDLLRLLRASEEYGRQHVFLYSCPPEKARLLKDELASEVAYNDSMLRNDAGTVLTAATGKEAASLFDDRGAATSLDGFLQYGGYCDALSVSFLGEDAGGPPALAKSLRVLFPPGLNELAITAQCSREDYHHVLERIRQLNR